MNTKPEQSRRSRAVQTTLTDAEYQALRRAAARAKRSLSSYIYTIIQPSLEAEAREDNNISQR